MGETKKLKFLMPRGYGAIRFAVGAVADIPEPWASHFIRNKSAELVDGTPKVKEPDPPKADKSKGKKKK